MKINYRESKRMAEEILGEEVNADVMRAAVRRTEWMTKDLEIIPDGDLNPCDYLAALIGARDQLTVWVSVNPKSVKTNGTTIENNLMLELLDELIESGKEELGIGDFVFRAEEYEGN
ncbi:MAG: hypothetical protein Q4C42_04540 [Clostridia bacterium]|nr:hypothetical protein [Clostridia bacterium]